MSRNFAFSGGWQTRLSYLPLLVFLICSETQGRSAASLPEPAVAWFPGRCIENCADDPAGHDITGVPAAM